MTKEAFVVYLAYAKYKRACISPPWIIIIGGVKVRTARDVVVPTSYTCAFRTAGWYAQLSSCTKHLNERTCLYGVRDERLNALNIKPRK